MNKVNVSMNEILTNTLRRTKRNAFTTNVADYDVFISVSQATKKEKYDSEIQLSLQVD